MQITIDDLDREVLLSLLNPEIDEWTRLRDNTIRGLYLVDSQRLFRLQLLRDQITSAR